MAKTNNPFTQKDILDSLDRAAFKKIIPTFNNVNFPPSIIRMTAFKGSTEWVISFEKVSLDTDKNNFIIMVYGFGNRIQENGYNLTIDIGRIENNPGSTIDIYNFKISILGIEYHISTKEDEYKSFKITTNTDSDKELKILRLASRIMPEKFLLPENGILTALNRKNLNLLVQTTDWHHPDIYNQEKPSDTECFKSLAAAIIKNDKSLFVFSEPINSHWSFWE